MLTFDDELLQKLIRIAALAPPALRLAHDIADALRSHSDPKVVSAAQKACEIFHAEIKTREQAQKPL